MSGIRLTGWAALRPAAGQEIEALTPADFGWKGLRRMSRAVQLCCVAIGEGLRRADKAVPFSSDSEAGQRAGLIVGTNTSNLQAIVDLRDDAERHGVQKTNPGLFPDTVLNVVGGHASVYFGLAGANLTVSNGAMAGLKAVEYAETLLTSGQLDVAVVCAVNLLPPPPFRSSFGEVTKESVAVLVLEREPAAGGLGFELRPGEGAAGSGGEASEAVLELALQADKLAAGEEAAFAGRWDGGAEGACAAVLTRALEAVHHE